MSRVMQSSKIEELFGVLYELVKPMLATENCVKCITQDGNISFTSDVEHLLSSLDIEHVAAELVIQALQSHKHTFGTGTKTLLFMMASLAKAVTQLHKLGIPSEKSLPVIQTTFANLSKDVEEISVMTQANLHLSNGVNCEETYPKTFTTEENCNITAKPESMTSFNANYRSVEAIYPCIGKEIPLFEFKQTRHQDVIHNLTDDNLLEHGSAPISENNDSVYLNMSNLQDLSSKSNDVEWFFDCSSSNEAFTAVTNKTHTDDHGCQGLPEFSFNSQKYLLCSEYQGCGKHSLNSIENGNNLTAVSINSTADTLSPYTSKSFLRSINCKHQNDILSDIGISSIKGDDQHDIDFEDCFDETDKKQHVSGVNKYIPSDNVCKNDSVLFKKDISANTCGSKTNESVVFNMCDKQSLSDNTFNAAATPQLFHRKCMKISDGDEFHASVSDTDIFDSSLAHDKSLITPCNGCDNPTTHHVSETLIKSKQKSSSTLAEVSNKLLDTSYIEPMSGTYLTCNTDTSSIEPMSGTYLTCNTVAGKKNIERFRKSDKKSSEHAAQDSEVKMLNTMLSFLGANRSHVNVSTSSRHLQCSPNRSLQPVNLQNKVLVNEPEINNAAWTTAFCEKSSVIQPENINSSINQESTTGLRNYNYNAFTLTSDNRSNGQCGAQGYITRNVGNDLQGNFSQEFSCETNSTGRINPASSVVTKPVNESTDLSFKEQDRINKINEPNSKNKEILLEYLLLQKRTQFRSSLLVRAMASSRHFYNNCNNTSDWTSSTQEDCKSTLQSENISTLDLLASNLNNANSARNLEYSNSKHLPVLVQNSSTSDLKFDNFGKICNLHSGTNDLSGKLKSSSCCRCVEASFGLPEEAKQACFSTKPHKVIALHDCHGDVADAAMLLLQNQMKEKENTRFNFDLVECLSIPSSTSSVSVVSGLTIPCNTHVLEKLEIIEQPLVTLLINADLDSNFHHKGYKPPLSKRIVIAKPYDESQESNERLWSVKALNIIKHLNVKLVLVKGKAGSVLLDMCEGAGVLVLTNISHHTLSVLSHLHRVDMVTYITLASEENLCSLCLVPLSSDWRDHLQKSNQNSATYFALITNTLDVQTVIFHCSSTMSAQIVEERFWKCLHSIANSQADGKVLPGGGGTEMWCADRIQYKSESALASQSHMQSVILEAVADIFRDYCQTVRQSTLHEAKQNPNQIQDSDFTQTLTREKNMTLLPQSCSSIRNFFSHKYVVLSDTEKDNKDSKFINDLNCLQSCDCNKVLDYSTSASGSSVSRFTDDSKQGPILGLNTSVKTKESHKQNVHHIQFSSSYQPLEEEVYDNFQAKVSAWMTAVDSVSILQNLGCLVISGINDKDITGDLAFL